MTDQDNDDEIRESLPCHVYEHEGTMWCLPVGYVLDQTYGASWRGINLDDDVSDDAAVWRHAIEREKARRAKWDSRAKVVEALADRIRNIASLVPDSIGEDLNDIADEVEADLP